MFWALMSTRGQEILDTVKELDGDISGAKFIVNREILDYIGYGKNTYPKFNCFVTHYAIYSRDTVHPTSMYDKDRDGLSLSDKFDLAIEEQDVEKIKQVCLAIARAELKEDISWE